MNSDLFLAILAMDSYNRGYGQGINGLVNSGALGNATISHLSNIQEGSSEVAAGFFAIAYDVSGVTDGAGNSLFLPGDKVISYRGTDVIDPLNPLGSGDFWNGWTLGAGVPYASQGGLAIAFYEQVAQHSVYKEAGSKPILTGHSLGGGLAGFVSMLSGSQAVGFDHMPFGAANDDEYIICAA